MRLGAMLATVLVVAAGLFTYSESRMANPEIRMNSPHLHKCIFLRIEMGMSVKKVYETIGCPPGDYSTEYGLPLDCDDSLIKNPGRLRDVWKGNHGRIILGYDANGNVSYRAYIQVVCADRSRGVARWFR